MDELKELISMVAGLPTVVVWVLVGYLVYKLAVLGSIYGVLRLLIERAHDWVTRPKRVEWTLIDTTVGESTRAELVTQILRLRSDNLRYIHYDDVQRLRKAIDLLLEQEKAVKK